MNGQLTLFESGSTLAKRWELDRSGVPRKTSAAQMVSGTYSVKSFSCVDELAQLISKTTTRQALCASLPHDSMNDGCITTKRALAQGAKVRGRRDFGLKLVPGLLFLDHDSARDDGGLTRQVLWDVLTAAVPALSSAGVVWRPSGSSHVFNGADDLTGLRGQHLYVMLADASDGPRVMKTLAARLWLAGLGRVDVSKAGSLLLRCPIDTAPSDAARLIFAAGAECVPPLEQRRGPAVVLARGGFLDSVKLVPDLTDEERGRYVSLVDQAKAVAMPSAMQRRAEHRSCVIAERLPVLMKQGVSAADAEARIGAAVDAAYGGTLLGDFVFSAVHDDGRHESVTVAQVLADRDRWHEVDVLDPIHPSHRGGAPDCRLFLHGTSPIAYSLDDSGAVYRLRAAQQRLVVSKGARAELVHQLAAAVAADPRVFMTDTGPVVVERDRQQVLSIERLMNLIGSVCLLVQKGSKGDVPIDVPRETAVLVLAAICS